MFPMSVSSRAFGAGVYRGLVTLMPWEDDIESVQEEYAAVEEKPYHYHVGYVVGTAGQLVSLVVLARHGSEFL